MQQYVIVLCSQLTYQEGGTVLDILLSIRYICIISRKGGGKFVLVSCQAFPKKRGF